MNMMRKNNNRGGNKHRGGGNRRYNNSGGNRQQNDGQNLQRQKHHATQMLGKYNDLLRNAHNNGDRVDVEYYQQHIEHYTRVLADIAAIEAERFAHQRESQIVPGGPNDPNAQAMQDSTNTDESVNDAAAGDSNTGQVSEEGNEQQSRTMRQHRRPYQQPSDNGAKEANANTTEIPLPGSIIPPI